MKKGRLPRWIALGDSITEGFTYPLWISHSLRESGQAEPDWINAAAAGNTAGQILERLESEVIVHAPARVFLNAGINDVQKGEGGALYGERMRKIIQRLRSVGMEVCVITTTALGPRKAALNADLIQMNACIRKLAEEFGSPVAEVFEPFREALDNGRPILIEDDTHLSREGYRLMAGAILKVIDPSLDLFASWEPNLEPGVPAQWEIRPASGQGPYWKIDLPESNGSSNWWERQESRRGYVMNPKRFDEQASAFVARTDFFLPAKSSVQIRVGGTIRALMIDGQPIALPRIATKWGIREAGIREYDAGSHEVKLEAENSFFAAFSSNQS